jgi:hypothetical protein
MYFRWRNECVLVVRGDHKGVHIIYIIDRYLALKHHIKRFRGHQRHIVQMDLYMVYQH